jgi:hypothetical protein
MAKVDGVLSQVPALRVYVLLPLVKVMLAKVLKDLM